MGNLQILQKAQQNIMQTTLTDTAGGGFRRFLEVFGGFWRCLGVRFLGLVARPEINNRPDTILLFAGHLDPRQIIRIRNF